MANAADRDRSNSDHSTDDILHRNDDGSLLLPASIDNHNQPWLSSWTRTASTLPGSVGNVRTPSRSFYHRAFHNSFDPAQYSSHGVRVKSAELASLAVSDVPGALTGSSVPARTDALPSGSDRSRPGFPRFQTSPPAVTSQQEGGVETAEARRDLDGLSSSALTAMIRNSAIAENDTESADATASDDASEAPVHDEHTPLIPSRHRSKHLPYLTAPSVERQVVRSKSYTSFARPRSRIRHVWRLVSHPKSWDRRTVWRQGVVYPASLLPAVFLGLLLNILDALSYGMILFPLGEAMFADLGSDGISMFYVSTIISQLVFSCGASIFRGGIGSEMIEVVPFFHKMAFSILARVGENNPTSVRATTILSFSISSVITGMVFFLMGACRLGALIGFFPRHILIGCIGGVGWFLVATGFEVSGRLPGTLEYNLPMLRRLFRFDTVFLWTVPLVLAITLLTLKRFIKSNFLVGGYFILVAAIFYLVKLIAGIPMSTLRDAGWVFQAPSATYPWWHFYTLYDFSAVNWVALLDTVPAMFALTFFGVLHVPINVPALGISTGEDNLDIDRELIAHGITNALSGAAGSIQNYLVYTNSLLFIASGGNSRLAGILLAIATAGIMVVGPAIIGYIPIMVVGALIFMLGIELMEEALVDTWGRLHKLEYLTVVIIVVTMGAWDFVIGIFIGIILACVSFVVQTSRTSAIRAIYSGEFVRSTVRRPPVQQRYLKDAGRQTQIIKLAGFLFFGTIVNVETTVRGLIDEEAFSRRPIIRFLVLDFTRVSGLDFSAAEALTRINRIANKRGVLTIISGLDVQGEVAKSLQNVGLFAAESSNVQIFETLNSTLEYCENEYLKVFYSRKEALLSQQQRRSSTNDPGAAAQSSSSSSLDVPRDQPAHPASSSALGDLITLSHSPRREYLQHAAVTTLLHEDKTASQLAAKWSSYRQPLPLLLQTFQDLSSSSSTRSESFWFPACAYFIRETYPRGTILYREGDPPEAFYLLESGMLRAIYELPQGRYSELIVAGRPCGELPFFGGTPRTATVKVEQDSVAWCLTSTKWSELKDREPELARELLSVSLKLTAERMDSITSYVLTMAA